MVGRWIRLAVLPLSAWWMRVLAESMWGVATEPPGVQARGFEMGGTSGGGAGRAPLGQMRLYLDS